MDYIYRNIVHIIGTLLVSIFFVFLIIPTLTSLKFVKIFFSSTAKEPFIAITAFVLFSAIYSWGWTRNLWEKYKNTWRLQPLQIVYPDYIFLFSGFSVLLIALFQNASIPSLSATFKSFASINLMIFLGWFLSSYFIGKKKDKSDNVENVDIHSLSDEPISSDKQDLLGREKFIEDLYKEITNLPFSDSFVFGLYGSWGEGKSSVINLLRNKVEKNIDFLIVNYDPWHFKDEEAILSSFYNQIEYALSERYIFPGLKRTFMKYQKLISFGLSQAGFKIDLLLSDESLEEIKQRVESYISRTGKKIIIFIDDVDRLQPEEALLIFKLVRLNAKFLNTIFLLSFDPVVVQNYLKDDLNADPAFLEKIVQKPVPLPAIEQNDVDQFLNVHIDNLFKGMRIPQKAIEKFEKEFIYIYQTQIRKLFKTLRHAKRYFNGLRSTLPPIKAEVHLYDFFILEVIRVFYPRVYNDIWRNPWFYIPLKWSDATYFLSPLNYSDENVKYSKIKEHIEDIVKRENEAEMLKELLKTIFFVEVENALGSRMGHDNVASSYRTEKRITHPESFRKYFMLKVSPSDISDEYVETTLDSWLSTDKAKRESVIEKTILELQQKDMLLEFFKRLLVFINTIPGDVIHDMVRVIYKNASRFSKKGTEDLWNSEYDKAQSLLLWLLDDRIEKSNIHSILEEVVTSTPDLPFAIHLILSCRKGQRGSLFKIYDSINIGELQIKVSQRLKEHFIEGGKDIFTELPERRDWGFILYQWSTNWMTFTDDNKEIVNNYIFSLIRDDAKKFVVFLMHLRESPIISNGQMTFDLNKLGRAYNLDEIQKIADKFKNEGSLTQEERESIEMFLKLYNEKANSNKTQ
ncbi:MAG: KAP family NTPase [Nitrospirae bacterium]|nr:KAP family NTPase [Nitrospirota bacterium]MCL5978160.1 KAP family NTPase [Nitrospirota bacterium]